MMAGIGAAGIPAGGMLDARFADALFGWIAWLVLWAALVFASYAIGVLVVGMAVRVLVNAAEILEDDFYSYLVYGGGGISGVVALFLIYFFVL